MDDFGVIASKRGCFQSEVSARKQGGQDSNEQTTTRDKCTKQIHLLFAHADNLCRVARDNGIVRDIVGNDCTCADYAVCADAFAARQNNSTRPYPHITAYFQGSLPFCFCFGYGTNRHIRVCE